jgi:transcriptional regulator with XRE-family HTH domain
MKGLLCLDGRATICFIAKIRLRQWRNSMDKKTPVEEIDIGAALRRVRLSKNMTLVEVSALAATDAGNLSRVERNEQQITVRGLARLCNALDMGVVEFLRHVERWQGIRVHRRKNQDELFLRGSKMMGLFGSITARDQTLLLRLADSMAMSVVEHQPRRCPGTDMAAP